MQKDAALSTLSDNLLSRCVYHLQAVIMGKFLTLLLPLLAGISAVTAQHGQDSPEEDADVRSMQNQFQHYTGYHGPTQSYKQPPPPTMVPPAPAAPCAYWLEQIKHQGVAAFNPNTAFRVFRNVKDFGAKGIR